VSRAARIGVIAAAVVAFVLVSVVLGRVIGAGNSERNAVIDVVKAQSHGDARGAIGQIDGCRSRPVCVARVESNVKHLFSRDRVRVLRIDGTTQFPVGAGGGVARIVWRAGNRLPIVQCVRLRRGGDPFSGFDVRVLALGAPIGRGSVCPGGA
jgi:hypothetical protein